MELVKLDINAYKWLTEKHPGEWSRSHLSCISKCDMLLNYMCECFNAIILEAREEPIIPMFESNKKLVESDATTGDIIKSAYLDRNYSSQIKPMPNVCTQASINKELVPNNPALLPPLYQTLHLPCLASPDPDLTDPTPLEPIESSSSSHHCAGLLTRNPIPSTVAASCHCADLPNHLISNRRLDPAPSFISSLRTNPTSFPPCPTLAVQTQRERERERAPTCSRARHLSRLLRPNLCSALAKLRERERERERPAPPLPLRCYSTLLLRRLSLLSERKLRHFGQEATTGACCYEGNFSPSLASSAKSRES
ncbi:hypothetical protein M5K25_025819 [Dendrobium thyrsiflorum]|uniref:Uncharacterized protein n=1 Tax=Dendrobium thyrsiflorum TaxID=117978 RepID=A0ABD0U4W8_DENTH